MFSRLRHASGLEEESRDAYEKRRAMLTNHPLGHHPHHHRLPLHRHPPGDHHFVSDLQHLVSPHRGLVTQSLLTSLPSTSYSNSTAAAPTKSVGTVSVSPSKTASTVPTAGAGKAALSGGALAGVLGLAAFVL